MSKLSFKNNILYYLLISNLHPKKIIFELINTKDRETYIEAQEILGIFMNKKNLDIERIKIDSRQNPFHIYISNEELIFLSYSNQKQITSDQIFQLFDEINYYLLNNLKERIYEGESFLMEDEKEDIKGTINRFIGDILSMKTIDSYIGSGDTENEREILKVDSKFDTIEEKKSENKSIEEISNNKNSDNNIIIKNKIKNFSKTSLNEIKEKSFVDKEKKNESSGEDIIKNKIIKNPTIPHDKSDKSSNIIKNDSKNLKIKNSTKTVFGSHSKLKNKLFASEKNNEIREKPKVIIKNHSINKSLNKNYTYNKYNYENLNLQKYKPDICTKKIIIGILISVIVLQIATIPLVLHFYDFSL